MTKKEKIEEPDTGKDEIGKPTRMHSIILKEKDKDGNFLVMDVDMVMPTGMFGEGHPMVMGVVDDRAYFVPYDSMAWFEQNYGVKKDTELAQALTEARKKKIRKPEDRAFV